MFNPFIWLLSLIFGPPALDTRKEYRVRCPDCYTVIVAKFYPPVTAEERIRTIECEDCGTETQLTIPIAPEECPDDADS